MIYCDTSLLVAALTAELATETSLTWLAAHRDKALCVSDWVLTEFSSSISQKRRRDELSSAMQSEVMATWNGMLLDNLIVVQVSGDAFRLAARFCEMSGSALRAGDALHLAVASLGGHSLATLDERMREAALAVGVAAEAI